MATRKIVCALAALCGLGLFSGLADADSETFTVDIQTTTIPETGYSGFIQIDQFDPAGGRVLESIEFDLLADLRGTLGFENTDPDLATTYRLELGWLVELQQPESLGLVSVSDSRRAQGLVDPFDGVLDYSGFSGATHNVKSLDISASGSTIDDGDLAAFTGTGTTIVPVLASYFPEAWAPGGSYETEFRNVTFGGELRVTYTYVPEPASVMALLMLGLALRRVR